MGDINDHHEEEVCNTRLGLGIGLDDFVRPKRTNQQQRKHNKSLICLDLSFPIHFKHDIHQQQIIDIGYKTEGSSSKTISGEDQERQQQQSTHSTSDNHEGVRKKLRLTKEQSTVLEDRFKQHTTLNTVQKQVLAEKLNLKPRQVEVWFQNRRARTKLKQTEVDCEFLKKCCENLSEENRMLKKELQELRSSSSTKNITTPLFVHQLQNGTAAATIAMCPSCEKLTVLRSSKGGDITMKHERSTAQN